MAQTQEQTAGTLDPSRTAGYQLRNPPSNQLRNPLSNLLSNLPDKHPNKT
jgi:hypothetical protein